MVGDTLMTRAVVALGANLGDRGDTVRRAVAALAARTRLVAASAMFETEPVGGPAGQPAFYNAVVVVETDLEPAGVLALAHELEAGAGRVRAEHWGPRTLDVDVIAFGDRISDDPELTLPHPRAHERAFVLLPWSDADPDAELPGRGRVVDLIMNIERHGVRRVGTLTDVPGLDVLGLDALGLGAGT